MLTVRNRSLDSPPKSLKDARDEQSRIAREIDKASISDSIFKGPKIIINDPNDPYHGEEEHAIRYSLRKLFFNKCAYCERIEYKPDVEHYRPKKKVVPPNGNNHGYYWLCYEWSNLLPSCSQCNRSPGKQNKFPVLGDRVTQPPLRTNGVLFYSRCRADHAYMLTERPGLLHPEVDEPETYFKLGWNGFLEPLDGPKGRAFHSIDTCDLNRGNLVVARHQIIESLIAKLNNHFFLFQENAFLDAGSFKQALSLALTDLKEQTDIEKPFSFVSYYIWEHFAQFVQDNFKTLSQVERELLVACREALD